MNLEIKALKAALLVVPKNDVRYYLNGLQVEILPPAGDQAEHIAIVVSTDGHRLVAAESAVEFEENEKPPEEGFSVIIPRETVEAALKMCPRKVKKITLNFENLTLGNIQFSPVDGRYPNWRRVISQKFSGETAQFNPEYLTKAVKSIAAYEETTYANAFRDCVVYHNGSNAALVSNGNPRIICVVMPFRSQSNHEEFPQLPRWTISSV